MSKIGEWKVVSPEDLEIYRIENERYLSYIEKDPNGKNPHEPGAKLDAGKVPAFQGLIDYFPRACMAVAEVSAHGATKYAWKSWESVPDGITRYSDALARHMFKKAMGETLDKDSGLPHDYHIAWGALAVLEMTLREQEKNNG